MKEFILESNTPVTEEQLREAVLSMIEDEKDGWRKVLLLPPDQTRLFSRANVITNILYEALQDHCTVDVMPALGTHMPMTEEELRRFFGDGIPAERFLVHDWRNDTVKIGEIEAERIRELSENVLDFKVDVMVNRRLLDPSYDQIISIGQVVPHEVAGMANYTKNIMVGTGGPEMINRSHYLGAVYGVERLIGTELSPVRRLYNEACDRFLSDRPLSYILTVAAGSADSTELYGLYCGKEEAYLRACALSQRLNITWVDRPVRKCVVYLDPDEFHAVWVGNKGIYRSYDIVEEGGEIVVIAPGIERFGEDPGIDRVIRKYGYRSRDAIVSAVNENEDLQENLGTAAHLIHALNDGRKTVTYCPGKLTKEEIESVGFRYLSADEAVKRYDPKRLKDGFNTLPDGEEIYYISAPSIGLWKRKRERTAE